MQVPDDQTHANGAPVPELYPPWVTTPDARKRWDLSHRISEKYFGASRLNPTVRFYARLLYASDWPT